MNFVNKNRSNSLTLPKDMYLEEVAYVILKSSTNKIWVSKIYKRKYGCSIWISSKIKRNEKFRIINKINYNELKVINKTSKLNGILSKEIEKNKVLLIKPPTCNFFIIKKNINLNEDLAWLIGFYFAEGNKNKDGIGVSNKELSLINKNIELFKKIFGIYKKEWKIYIKTNKKTIYERRLLKEKWSKLLKQKYKLCYSRLAYEECIDMRINSRVLSYFLDLHFKNSIKKILKNKKLAISFLRGYAIGDGSVILRKKQIHSIAITVKDKCYLRYLTRAFIFLFNKKPGIRATKGAYELSYCNVNMITEVILNKLFIDLDRQWNKLILGYINKQYTRARIKYWDKIINKQLNASEIGKLSGNSHWSVRDALNYDIQLGLVNAEYKGINGKNYKNKFYYLSPKGVNLLNLIKGR